MLHCTVLIMVICCMPGKGGGVITDFEETVLIAHLNVSLGGRCRAESPFLAILGDIAGECGSSAGIRVFP
jgi:hypothetical protein